VAAAVRLHRARDRRESGLTLLEGPNLLQAAAAVNAAVRVVFALEDDARSAELAGRSGYEVIQVTREVLDRLAPSRHPRGPVAVAEIPPSRPALVGNLVVLWGVGDPGNAGTLIRSAAAFGFGVACGPGTVDPWSPKVLRAGAGAHFAVPIETGVPDPLALRTRGYRMLAAVVDGGVPPVPGQGRVALFVGDEAHGLDEEVVDACDTRVTIPMRSGLESLNASVAGSILMYELKERSAGAPAPRD
jgi:TrmH family RNA methyltransferase